MNVKEAFRNMYLVSDYQESVNIIEQEPPAARSTERGNYLWLIDPGHGKLTPGKRSPTTLQGDQLLEYQFNSIIASFLTDRITKAGYTCEPILTPQEAAHSANVLQKRIRKANSHITQKQKIYISIHGNASYSPRAQGIETWFYQDSTASRNLAKVFQSSILTGLAENYTDIIDRGIRTFKEPSQKTFAVLKYTTMPAILTENGFYTNQKEKDRMLTREWIDAIVTGHFNAIEYIEENLSPQALFQSLSGFDHILAHSIK